MTDDRERGAAGGDAVKPDTAKGGVKTAQPYSEPTSEPYADMGGGSPNRSRPDQADDPEAQAEARKTTQRQE